jgi:hypothetical protein
MYHPGEKLVLDSEDLSTLASKATTAILTTPIASQFLYEATPVCECERGYSNRFPSGGKGHLIYDWR